MNEIFTYKIVNNKGEDVWNYASLEDAIKDGLNLCKDSGESYTVIKKIHSEEVVCVISEEK